MGFQLYLRVDSILLSACENKGQLQVGIARVVAWKYADTLAYNIEGATAPKRQGAHDAEGPQAKGDLKCLGLEPRFRTRVARRAHSQGVTWWRSRVWGLGLMFWGTRGLRKGKGAEGDFLRSRIEA